MPHTVTLRGLDALNACSDQRALFARTFPDGITIAVDNYRAVAKAAAKAGLDVSWYAQRVLVGDEWEAYSAAITPAWAAYAAAVVEARVANHSAVARTRAAREAAYRVAKVEALCAILARRGAP